MILYHGTSGFVARKAVEDGLQPRRNHGVSNWKHTVESHPDCVYLTDIYGPYFAMTASKDGEMGLIEIDSDLLDTRQMVPDEDFLEQASRSKVFHRKRDMKARTTSLRKSLKQYSGLWRQSVQQLGTCAYYGAIPSSAITRVSVLKPESNPEIITMFSDPTITILNHRFCFDVYKMLTNWMMGEEVSVNRFAWASVHIPTECSDAEADALFHQMHPQPDKCLKYFRDVLSKKDGLTRLK